MTGWITALEGRQVWTDNQTELIQGDAVRVLQGMEDGSADLVLADPPYSSGGAFRSDRVLSSDSPRQAIGDFAGDNRDQRAYFAWSVLWLSEAYRVLKPGRIACVFTDWRQLPTTTDALQAAGFVWRGLGVWDKGNGRPAPGINRGRCEFIVWGSRGPLDLGHDVYLPGVISARIERDERELHQTPKPVTLLAKLVTLAPPGGLVVDPFTGSGSTLVACRDTGRRAVGVELDSAHVETARVRLATTAAQLNLLGE